MEAFKPRTTSDLLLDPDGVSRVKQWIRDTTGKAKVLVIESASVGAGISTLIRLACSEEHVEPIIISSSAQKLKSFLKDASSSSYTVDFRKKILVIDSLDAVFSEPTCAAELSDYFKSIATIPAICAGHRLRSSTSKLHDMLTKAYHIDTVSFPEIDPTKALAYLHSIRDSLGRTAPVAWRGDLRNALASLDADVQNALKDDQCDGVDAVWRVLFDPTLTIRESISMHGKDISMITAGTHENYPLTGQSIDACAKLADIYSITDVMDECMYDTQRWELGDVCTAISSGGPVAYIDKHKSQHHKKINLSKFGTFWSRGNNQRTKEKALRNIRSVMLENGMHSSSTIDSLATIRALVTSQNWDALLPILESLPNDTVLAIMRLWKSGFTQAHYNALKKKRL